MSLTGLRRDSGVGGFLPALLTGMAPLVLTAPLGIKRGGRVRVRGCVSGGPLLLTSKWGGEGGARVTFGSEEAVPRRDGRVT